MVEIRTGNDFVNTCELLALVEACRAVINCHCTFWSSSGAGGPEFSLDFVELSDLRFGLEEGEFRLVLEDAFDVWRAGSFLWFWGLVHNHELCESLPQWKQVHSCGQDLMGCPKRKHLMQ